MKFAAVLLLVALAATAEAARNDLRSLLSGEHKNDDDHSYYYPKYYCKPHDDKDHEGYEDYECPEYYECEEIDGDPYCEKQQECYKNQYGDEECEYKDVCWYHHCVYKPIYCKPNDYKGYRGHKKDKDHEDCPEYYECEKIHGKPYCKQEEKCYKNKYGKEECKYVEECWHHQCVYKPVYCEPDDYSDTEHKDDKHKDECPDYYDCKKIKGDPYCKHEQKCYRNGYGKKECEYDEKCWDHQCLPYYCDPYAQYDECEKEHGYDYECKPIYPVCYYDHEECYYGKCVKKEKYPSPSYSPSRSYSPGYSG